MNERKMIYLDDAIDAINGLPNCPNGYSDAYDKASIISALEEVPSALSEIIRCKDCKHYDHSEDPDFGEWCYAWGDSTTEDGFCHHAERINDD